MSIKTIVTKPRAMNFKKIKWMLGILFVFLLILATNLIDQKSFEEVQESIETIYEDRLVAQDIVFDISTLIQKKDMANASLNQHFFTFENKTVNAEIDQLFTKYNSTKLTDEERIIFEKMKKALSALAEIETVSGDFTPTIQNSLEAQFKLIKQDINRLKEIQLEEGKRALDKSKKAVQSSQLFTQMEIWGLIILAIIFQLIIIAGPKINTEPTEEERN